MKPADEAQHLLSLLRDLPFEPRRRLVRRLLDRMLDRLDAASLLPPDTDRGNLDHCVVVALHVGGDLADVIRLCVRALEADDPPAELFARIAVGYAATDPDLHLGRTRREQVRAFGRNGAASRRRFTDADRDRWRAMRSSAYQQHSTRRAAALIAKAEGIPDAHESVRKALSKENG